MVAFPTLSLPKENVKMRFLEEGVPLALGQRWYGMPRGVWIGFVPSVTPASDVLTLDVDPNHNFSLLRVGSENLRTQVEVFTPDPIMLDFSGHATFPIYVLAKASFRDKKPTQGVIFTRTTGPSGPQEVLICQVDKPAADLVVTSAAPITKNLPTAFQGQRFGFMPGGAIDDLVAASAVGGFIVAARVSAHTGAHADLSTRIAADLVGPSMADRLALRQVHVVSNVHGPVTGTSVNVSGSFAETGREIGPSRDIEAGGTTSVEGAITAAPRNIGFVVNATTGERLIESGSRLIVLGRLSFTSGTAGVGKEIRFTNASTAVDGNGTNPFQAPLEEGDIVLAPDGKYYEIETFTDPNNAVLKVAYQGPGAPDVAIDAPFRRFTLDFERVDGTPVTPPDSPEIRFLFPTYFRADRAIFDGLLLIKRDGERPVLPSASETEEGKFLLAVDGGLVGSIRTIRDNGSAVGNDFHTLNFLSGGATDAGGGVANVAVPGATGPPGTPANQGPDGPSGDAGPGYTATNATLFEGSAFSSTPTPTSVSFSVDFSVVEATFSAINNLWGGWSGFDGHATLNLYEITDITQTGPTTGRIDAEFGPGVQNARFKVYLGAAQ